VAAIHRYAKGIPRVVNLLSEHSLVSGFVDQQKTISADIVESIARDFELTGENGSGKGEAATATHLVPRPELMEALRSLSALAERLRQGERSLPKAVGQRSAGPSIPHNFGN